jgi:uncharacterized membrane protein YgcG
MHSVKTRLVGALALAALGVLGNRSARGAAGAEAPAPGTASLSESPPVPANPGGPVTGRPPFADENETRAVEEAFRRASAPGHPVALVLNPAADDDTPAQRVEKLRSAWPDRIILFASQRDQAVFLAVPDALRDRFPEEQRARLVHEVGVATMRSTFPRTLVRVAGEIAMLAEGKTPAPWIAWKHPLKTIGGGQDEDPAPLALGIGIGLALLLIVCWFLYTLVTNPMAIVGFLVQGAIEGLIGGIFGGGGGGGGGGGFSGGGGSFGGGGASGSW